MEIDQETKSRISDTVEGILLTADMDQATEFQVRTMAAERLGIDLSNLDHRRLVRQVLESFLLSMDISADEQAVADPSVREETREVVREEQEAKPEELDSDGDVICKLSNKRSVVIRDFKGRKMVWIGEYHEKDGKHVPSPKGISLTAEQWLAFRKSVPAIEAAIMKIETRTRGNQNDDMPNSLIDSTSLGLVRIKTTRLDVKNYQCWAQQMESFLNQLKIAYVLTDSCPSSNLSPGASNEEIAQAKAPVQRWVDDDYICHHIILNSLSDDLYDQYSQKTMSAKELWEELKLVYFSEHETKRSQVKKYIEFQMVDGDSILEQVQEFNKIADSIVAAGMSIEENFHVSVIISKLPPSWKDCRLRLTGEEYLPFWMLMECLRAEEEARNKDRSGEPTTSAHVHPARKIVPKMRNPMQPVMPGNKRELEKDSKAIVCYTCGKRGHISRYCNS
ncbi:uncharacterized protein LOC131166482 isoform X2 [Malania oleifera]|uniref:uncharacterized protein LOC131166482 isoform X2 n=1 Tax=Malania oleifera TaxID=397392 RepID=UPI0025ADD189|nr:uncharacterized protein LOC131166482 isoform X2 [Malania oleifera]